MGAGIGQTWCGRDEGMDDDKESDNHMLIINESCRILQDILHNPESPLKADKSILSE